ncbi:NAD(P)-dependent oxidoreductase [Ornithinimicrobium cavernae]|uniref:NAD(P)-dependent oxidoreductase n=1 Tax=Ornithinimicrobium cavernae TaxID=2666047 RepID=UPI000D696BAE|nr:NAD(P)-dependent oxidoreductase [Ornithinimicrobium cavernae]
MTGALEKGPVGFVGLGNMGSRMAGQLVGQGCDVLAFDRDPAVAERVGVRGAPDLATLAEQAEVVLLSLPDSTVVESVVLGPEGLEERLRPGTVVADLSTCSPASTRSIHARLGERGVSYVDAGVSGGAAAAARGTLTLMVGGDADAIDRLEPVFAIIADRVCRMGGSGAGHTAKVLNNFLNAMNLSASAEVLVAGAKSGVDPAQLLEVINASSGANWATEHRFPSIVQGDYLEGGLTSHLMLKDLLLYVQHLGEIGVPSLHASGPVSAFGVALQTGRGDLISNRVVDALGDLAGGVRIAAHAHNGEEAS